MRAIALGFGLVALLVISVSAFDDSKPLDSKPKEEAKAEKPEGISRLEAKMGDWYFPGARLASGGAGKGGGDSGVNRVGSSHAYALLLTDASVPDPRTHTRSC